jgi:Calcineurin-like phosphoesterase
MIRDLLVQRSVIEKLAAGRKGAAAAARALHRRDGAALELSRKYEIAPDQLKELVNTLGSAIGLAEQEQAAGAFMPRDPNSAILQSALERFYREFNCVAPPPKRGFAPAEPNPISEDFLQMDPLVKPADRAGLVEFGTHDPRWVFAFIAARTLASARGVHDFPDDRAPKVTMGESARLILVGDWASGVKRARDVADHMELFALEGVEQKRDTHVICLGDVYYAGLDDEYENRCLAWWPVKRSDRAKIGSWALNGNHDMYCGGHGYFGKLLADSRFKAQHRSSYFLLENAAWRIAGLDTAYDPPDPRGECGNLYGNQAAWLAGHFDREPAKRIMLLSHHQPFSAWEKRSPLLERALAPVFAQRQIDAWFWGHEHRCAVYRGARYVQFASLIGHGGVPVMVGRKGNARKAPFTYEYRETHTSGYQYLGFIVVDIDGRTCVATYYNERGLEHHREVV